MGNETEEFQRAWSVSDYGNIAAIDVRSAAAAGQPKSLFGTSLPQGTSTIKKDNRLRPSQKNLAVAQDVMRDPKAFVNRTATPEAVDQSLLDKSKTILANLFNTEDEKDLRVGPANLSGVESAWDGMLSAFNWGYDRINQGLSWAQSAAPGGIDTFTWDQAGQISVGQAAVTSNAQLINQMREKFGLPGQAIGAVGGMIFNPLGAIGAQAGVSTGAMFSREGFNILDPAQRKKAFEEEAVGKWATGLTDAVVTIFADPLIVGGKFLKVARLKYVDSPISVADNQMARVAELEKGVDLVKEGRVEELSPIARFVYDAVTPNAAGERMSARRIQMRAEIEDAGNAEGVAEALATIANNDYETARIVMQAALGDGIAAQELAKRSVLAADTLANAQRDKLVLSVRQNPEKLAIEMNKIDEAILTSQRVYDEAAAGLAEGRATSDAVDAAFRDLSNNIATKRALEDGTLFDPLVSFATIDEKVEAADAMVAELVAREEWFKRALNYENYGALYSANRGFSPDNALGKFVSKRRDARAEAKYQRKMTAGQGFRSQDYFGASRFRRTVRLVTRLWDETPAYYVGTAGDSTLDQGREIGAYLDSLEYLGSGNALNVLDRNGNVIRTIDGVARKNELYGKYLQARAARQDTSLALQELQDDIARDLQSVYGLPKEVVDYVMGTMFKEQKDLTEQILRSKNGTFFDKSNQYLSVAPFLKSQLAQGVYLLPMDRFEKIAKNIASGKIKDPYSPVVMTKGQVIGSKIAAADSIFQDLWRPAVLFRLGYTQRNVAEGTFRSMVFNSSFSPLLWAGKAGYLGVRNARKAKRAARRTAEAEAEVRRPSAARDQFDNLVKQQKGIQERYNALFGARQALEEQEAAQAVANVVPLPLFTPDANGLVSTDGAWRIQRQVKEIEAPAAKARRFQTVNKETGAAKYGDVEIEPLGKGQWLVKGPTGQEIVKSRNAARVTARKIQDELDAQAGPAAPVVQESFLITQLDPTTGELVAGTKRFATAADATAEVDRMVQRAFGPNGRMSAGNPQLNLVYEKGRKARRTVVTPFVDVDNKRFASVAEIDRELARLTKDGDDVAAAIENIGARPVPAVLKNTRFQNWRDDQIVAIDEEIQNLKGFRETFIEANAKMLDLDPKDVFAALDPSDQRKLIFLDNNMADLATRRKALERDDYFALGEYQAQGAAKLRANNGAKMQTMPFGMVLDDAFGNPRNADLRFRNMSANNTVKATLAARLQLSDSLIYKMKMTNYVEVYPKDGARYWEGMADMLRQYSVDALGQMILKGRPTEEIALWLLSKEGQATRNAIDDAWSFHNGFDEAIPPRIGNEMERAIQYVDNVRAGLVQITAGKTEVWDLLRSGPASPEQLKRILQGNPALGPVIGYTTEFSGVKKAMDIWRSLTQKGFEWIGTMPEDAFVRAPFYAERYGETRNGLIASLERQFGGQEKIPLELIYAAENQAARRALKDTKDFLYTIDRRTNLGKYGESIFPFISATQNSITAIGKLTRRDPALPGMMLALWQAPTKMGWEDENGNIIIPLPKELIPDGVEDFFGLTGMKNISISKGALNVVFPETGYAFAPRPSAPMQVLSSELMKKGFLGYSVEAPPLLVSFLGQKDADTLWQQWKNYVYGEESAISSEFASYDKVFPPIANKLIQYIQKDGSSQYGYQYALQAKTQALRWWAGERDDYPTPEEIMQRTNGMFILRMMGNAFAFTPPAYESAVQPLVDMQRAYDQLYGIEGPMKFSENFGDVLLTIGNTASTSNVGGAMSSSDAVRNIKKYSDLIRRTAPDISDENLDIFGILVNGDPKDNVYDGNAYRWLSTTNIPGTTRKWREVNSGAEAEAEVQRQAGWVEWIKFKGQLDAMRQQRGLKSFKVKGAEQLNSYRREFLDNMKANPLYAAWVTDFESMGSSKTYDAVRLLRSALNDPEFMASKDGDSTWEAAALYMETRDKLIELVKDSGKGLGSKENEQLALEWDEFRNNLIDQNAGWAAIANRYLNGDDVPRELGTSFADVG